jgi:uncharacterized membrane protein
VATAPGSPLRAARLRRPLRASLSQLASAVVGGLAGLGVARVTIGPQVDADRVVGLMITIGFGVLSVVTVVFSLLFLVLQWAAGTYTPRLTLFRDAPLVWRTFAYAFGVFVFCMAATIGIGRRTEVSVAGPFLAIVLTLGAVWLIRDLQLQAFSSIQLQPTLATIAAAGVEVISRLPAGGGSTADRLPLGPPTATLTWDGPGRTLQQVDVDGLVATARAGDGVVVVRARAGAGLLPGAALADVHGAGVAADEVRRALNTGVERTMAQDPLFGLRLLADIALRALSPAVNDPATAVQALDRLHELLAAAVDREVGPAPVRDADGVVRVVVPLPDWDDYLATALDDVIAARGGAPMVTRRLVELLDDLVERTGPDRRPAVERRRASLRHHSDTAAPTLDETTVRGTRARLR